MSREFLLALPLPSPHPKYPLLPVHPGGPLASLVLQLSSDQRGTVEVCSDLPLERYTNTSMQLSTVLVNMQNQPIRGLYLAPRQEVTIVKLLLVITNLCEDGTSLLART